jgi:hypothetical protein
MESRLKMDTTCDLQNSTYGLFLRKIPAADTCYIFQSKPSLKGCGACGKEVYAGPRVKQSMWVTA